MCSGGPSATAASQSRLADLAWPVASLDCFIPCFEGLQILLRDLLGPLASWLVERLAVDGCDVGRFWLFGGARGCRLSRNDVRREERGEREFCDSFHSL